MTKLTKARRAAGKARWAGMTKQEVSAQQKRNASAPRSELRCFCGERSMWKAANRYFDCCRRNGVITLDLERKKELNDGRIKRAD
jgi:hypothetical protein